MKRPIEPDESDCCGSGCNPCIFDVYEKQLLKYKELQRTNAAHEERNNAISQLEYTTFTLIEKRSLCDSHNLLVFKSKSNVKKPWWNPGDHFLYKYAYNNITCTRAYTPFLLPNSTTDENVAFMIVVKDYKNNSVSTRLCSMNIGDDTLWRGPYGSYNLIPNQFKRIIMIAQGTGIALFKSIIQSVINNEDNFTTLILLYCCKRQNQILFRKELYKLKSYWNFTYRIFVSSIEDTCDKLMYLEPIENHRLNENDIDKYKPFLLSDQVLLCGSSSFMEYFKKIFEQHPIIHNNIVTF